MKTLITTLNAKYIHTSLAIRLLYVANKDRFDVSFKEFTIKEKIETIVQEILDSSCQIVALGVYIWNVEQTAHLIRLLKLRNPQLIIILGGPEVSYEPAYFIDNWAIDYVISGEGEFVLGQLLEAIECHPNGINIPSVSSKNQINPQIAQADIVALSLLDSPYQIPSDGESLQNKLVYIETSRGCPYQCSYCLSSLEKGVRYFPKTYIFDNLLYLINHGVKTMKFLDRTFNLNKVHTSEIFNFLIDHYRPQLSCQFEIYADLLPDELIDTLNSCLPKNYFRFEIGIQSTHQPTNVAVKRLQNFDLLASKVQRIREANIIDLHLDLIAGLPFETLELFIVSFNQVFELKAKELQLGFLKLLRGTHLRRKATQHDYQFQTLAPYQIISNRYISEIELEQIHQVEHFLEWFWNSGKFQNSLALLLSNCYPNNAFLFFETFHLFCRDKQMIPKSFQLEHLYLALYEFALTQGVDLYEELRLDYLNNFSIRPNGNWINKIEKSVRKQLLYQISQHKEFLHAHGINRKMIDKQSLIDYDPDGGYRLTVFNYPEGSRYSEYRLEL